jgi:predicted transcriptional regulator
MLAEYESERGGADPTNAPQERQVSQTKTSAKNRGRLDTVAEIVNSCAGGANKSRIMLVANINSVVATEMLEKLQASALVSAKKDGNSVIYSATEEGMNFVDRYSNLVSMLCPGLVPQTRVNELSRSAEAWT